MHTYIRAYIDTHTHVRMYIYIGSSFFLYLSTHSVSENKIMYVYVQSTNSKNFIFFYYILYVCAYKIKITFLYMSLL